MIFSKIFCNVLEKCNLEIYMVCHNVHFNISNSCDFKVHLSHFRPFLMSHYKSILKIKQLAEKENELKCLKDMQKCFNKRPILAFLRRNGKIVSKCFKIFVLFSFHVKPFFGVSIEKGNI